MSKDHDHPQRRRVFYSASRTYGRVRSEAEDLSLHRDKIHFATSGVLLGVVKVVSGTLRRLSGADDPVQARALATEGLKEGIANTLLAGEAALGGVAKRVEGAIDKHVIEPVRYVRALRREVDEWRKANPPEL